MRKISKRKIDDSGIPELGPRDFARMRPAQAVMPKFVAAVKRGRPKLANPKGMMSFRLDANLLTRVKKSPEVRKRAIKAFERAVRNGA